MSNATKCDRCGYYTRDARRLHVNGIAYVYDLCPDCVRALEKWMEYHFVTDAPERVTNQAETLHDTREKLEADVDTALYGASMTDDGYISLEMAIGWLDRQAAITERECREYEDALREQHHKRIAELKAEIDTLKEHRAGNMERLRELTDECAELRKYRDEWKGLAEKYRADSIAAQEETERYRAKLGDVLDAIHEAERAAR